MVVPSIVVTTPLVPAVLTVVAAPEDTVVTPVVGPPVVPRAVLTVV
jgi:hypothetical protein